MNALRESTRDDEKEPTSATFILAEEDDFPGMNEQWARWFPVAPPARQGARLPIRPGGMKVSVAVIAEA